MKAAGKLSVVVDSSVAVCWRFRTNIPTLSIGALDHVQRDGMTIPPIFWYEIRNVPVVNERHKRIAEKQVNEALTFIDELPRHVDAEGANDDMMRLARSHRLTVYDAAYLELALRKGAPLATLDRRLAEAARAEGVSVVE